MFDGDMFAIFSIAPHFGHGMTRTSPLVTIFTVMVRSVSPLRGLP